MREPAGPSLAAVRAEDEDHRPRGPSRLRARGEIGSLVRVRAARLAVDLLAYGGGGGVRHDRVPGLPRQVPAARGIELDAVDDDVRARVRGADPRLRIEDELQRVPLAVEVRGREHVTEDLLTRPHDPREPHLGSREPPAEVLLEVVRGEVDGSRGRVADVRVLGEAIRRARGDGLDLDQGGLGPCGPFSEVAIQEAPAHPWSDLLEHDPGRGHVPMREHDWIVRVPSFLQGGRLRGRADVPVPRDLELVRTVRAERRREVRVVHAVDERPDRLVDADRRSPGSLCEPPGLEGNQGRGPRRGQQRDDQDARDDEGEC